MRTLAETPSRAQIETSKNGQLVILVQWINHVRCRNNRTLLGPSLFSGSLPSAVVDGVLVGRAGGHAARDARPLIRVLEALLGIGLGRGVEDARELQILQLEHAARFLHQVVRVLRRVLVDGARGFALGEEHLVQRRTVELVAGGFAARGVRLHQHAQALLLGDADPRLPHAHRLAFAALQRLDALAHGAGELLLDLLALEEALEHFTRREIRAVEWTYADRSVFELFGLVDAGLRLGADG